MKKYLLYRNIWKTNRLIATPSIAFGTLKGNRELTFVFFWFEIGLTWKA